VGEHNPCHLWDMLCSKEEKKNISHRLNGCVLADTSASNQTAKLLVQLNVDIAITAYYSVIGSQLETTFNCILKIV